MLSGAHGGHTLALQQLSRDGVRLLGRLVDAEGTKLAFAADLAENMHYADRRAAAFRRAVDAASRASPVRTSSSPSRPSMWASPVVGIPGVSPPEPSTRNQPRLTPSYRPERCVVEQASAR